MVCLKNIQKRTVRRHPVGSGETRAVNNSCVFFFQKEKRNLRLVYRISMVIRTLSTIHLVDLKSVGNMTGGSDDGS